MISRRRSGPLKPYLSLHTGLAHRRLASRPALSVEVAQERSALPKVGMPSHQNNEYVSNEEEGNEHGNGI